MPEALVTTALQRALLAHPHTSPISTLPMVSFSPSLKVSEHGPPAPGVATFNRQ